MKTNNQSFPQEIQEIIDNKETIVKSLERAKAKLLANHNPNGQNKPNKFLESQVLSMETKLNKLAEATFEMQIVKGAGKAVSSLVSEGRKVVASAASSLLPNHLRNNDNDKSKRAQPDMNVYLKQRATSTSNSSANRRSLVTATPSM